MSNIRKYVVKVNKKSFTVKLSVELVQLWESVTLTLKDDYTLSDMLSDIKWGYRRTETLEEYAIRNILKALKVRNDKANQILYYLRPVLVEDHDIKNKVWELVNGQFGGFANTPEGIFGRPWEQNGKDVFIYRLHQKAVKPTFKFNRVIMIEQHGHVVWLEYNMTAITEVDIVSEIRRIMIAKLNGMGPMW